MYQRAQYQTIADRILEPRRFIRFLFGTNRFINKDDRFIAGCGVECLLVELPRNPRIFPKKREKDNHLHFELVQKMH